MGCWYETCLISNLPIYGGDPVVAFLVAQEKNNINLVSGSFRPTDFVFPVSLPITAEYNDYGSIENYRTQTVLINHIEMMFNKSLGCILEEISKDGCELDGYSIGLVMFHKQLYETCVNTISSKYYETMRDKIKKHIVDISNGRPNFIDIHFVNYDFSVDTERKDLYFIDRIIKYVLNEFNSCSNKYVKDVILEDFSALFAGRSAISNTLSALRKTWIPSSGKGSQCDAFRAHILLANSVKELAMRHRETDDLYMMFLNDDFY